MITTELIDKLSNLLQYKNLSLAAIEKISGMNRRTILYEMDQVNEAFQAYGIQVTLEEGEVLTLSEFNFEPLIEEIFTKNKFLFQQERPLMIILYLFLKQEFTSVSHLQDLLKMSKNTILSDLQDANVFSQPFDVSIQYTRQQGYELAGHELDRRTLIDRTVSSLLNYSTGKWLIAYIAHSWDLDLNTAAIYQLLDEIDNLAVVKERLEGVVYLLAILDKGPQLEDESIQLNQHEKKYIENSDVAYLTNEIVRIFPRLSTQKPYITIQLLSAIQGRLETDQSPFFEDILEETILNVQGYIGSIFPNDQTFRRNFYNHLVPSYFRMKYHIRLENPLKDKMIQDYPDLFYLIKRSFEPVAKGLNIEITDDEAAYFVMHFGSYFTNPNEVKAPKITAIIICPQGIGTSILLKNLFSSVMPQVHFIKHASDTLNVEDLSHVDFIVSTIYLEVEKPVYQINPTLSRLELAVLKRSIYEQFKLDSPSLRLTDDLYEKIEPYTEEKNAIIIKAEMDQILDEDLQRNQMDIQELKESILLTEQMIVQTEQVSDWRAAIRLASQPLLEQDYITEDYIEAMIASVETFGPYIVLAPQVAIPHAKPTAGSKKLGVSLLQLKEAVHFKSKRMDVDKPVHLIFVLSIIDNYSHLGILKRIYSLIENESVIQELVEAETKDAILKVIATHFNDIEPNS